MHIKRIQEEKIFSSIVAAVPVQLSLSVVVACVEMLVISFGCVGKHGNKIDEACLCRRSGSGDGLVSGMVLRMIRPAQAKELELVLVKPVFSEGK